MQTGEFKTLSEIFSETDTVEFGPFKIMKPISMDWDAAVIRIDDCEIAFRPEQKRILAALSALPDHKLTYADYVRVLEKQETSLEKISQLLTTQISLIKTRLKLIPDQTYSELIQPIKLHSISMEERGYYLRDDFGRGAIEEPDVLQWGNFRMTKTPGDSWETSRFYVGDEEISFPPLTKIFLSLMLEKPDKTITVGDVSDFYSRQGQDISLENAQTALRAMNKVRALIRATAGDEPANQIHSIGRAGMSSLPLRQKGYCLK